MEKHQELPLSTPLVVSICFPVLTHLFVCACTWLTCSTEQQITEDNDIRHPLHLSTQQKTRFSGRPNTKVMFIHGRPCMILLLQCSHITEMCVHAKSLQLCNPKDCTHQAPLLGFSRQEYWRDLPCPPLRDLPNPGIKPMSPVAPKIAGGFFTAEPLRKPTSQRRGPQSCCSNKQRKRRKILIFSISSEQSHMQFP